MNTTNSDSLCKIDWLRAVYEQSTFAAQLGNDGMHAALRAGYPFTDCLYGFVLRTLADYGDSQLVLFWVSPEADYPDQLAAKILSTSDSHEPDKKKCDDHTDLVWPRRIVRIRGTFPVRGPFSFLKVGIAEGGPKQIDVDLRQSAGDIAEPLLHGSTLGTIPFCARNSFQQKGFHLAMRVHLMRIGFGVGEKRMHELRGADSSQFPPLRDKLLADMKGWHNAMFKHLFQVAANSSLARQAENDQHDVRVLIEDPEYTDARIMFGSDVARAILSSHQLAQLNRDSRTTHDLLCLMFIGDLPEFAEHFVPQPGKLTLRGDVRRTGTCAPPSQQLVYAHAMQQAYAAPTTRNDAAQCLLAKVSVHVAASLRSMQEIHGSTASTEQNLIEYVCRVRRPACLASPDDLFTTQQLMRFEPPAATARSSIDPWKSGVVRAAIEQLEQLGVVRRFAPSGMCALATTAALEEYLAGEIAQRVRACKLMCERTSTAALEGADYCDDAQPAAGGEPVLVSGNGNGKKRGAPSSLPTTTEPILFPEATGIEGLVQAFGEPPLCRMVSLLPADGAAGHHTTMVSHYAPLMQAMNRSPVALLKCISCVPVDLVEWLRRCYGDQLAVINCYEDRLSVAPGQAVRSCPGTVSLEQFTTQAPHLVFGPRASRQRKFVVIVGAHACGNQELEAVFRSLPRWTRLLLIYDPLSSERCFSVSVGAPCGSLAASKQFFVGRIDIATGAFVVEHTPEFSAVQTAAAAGHSKLSMQTTYHLPLRIMRELLASGSPAKVTLKQLAGTRDVVLDYASTDVPDAVMRHIDALDAAAVNKKAAIRVSTLFVATNQADREAFLRRWFAQQGRGSTYQPRRFAIGEDLVYFPNEGIVGIVTAFQTRTNAGHVIGTEHIDLDELAKAVSGVKQYELSIVTLQQIELFIADLDYEHRNSERLWQLQCNVLTLIARPFRLRIEHARCLVPHQLCFRQASICGVVLGATTTRQTIYDALSRARLTFVVHSATPAEETLLAEFAAAFSRAQQRSPNSLLGSLLAIKAANSESTA